jgi:predicted PurR-regulated permease PerM
MFLLAAAIMIGGLVVFMIAINARSQLAGLLAPLAVFGLKPVADLLQSALAGLASTAGLIVFVFCLVIGFLLLAAGRLVSRAQALDQRVEALDQTIKLLEGQVAELKSRIAALAPGDRD